MKLIAVLILYIVSCEAYYDWCSGPYMKDVMLKCLASNKASYDDLSDFLGSKYAKDEKAKCFRACVYTSCKYITHDGRLYTDLPNRLGHLLNSGIPAYTQPIAQAANYCIHSTGRYQSVCDTTEAFVQCMLKKTPVRLILRGVF